MFQISFRPSFIKQMNKLEKNLIDEVFYKIELLKKSPSHPELKTHKLHGKLKGMWGFSVNYKIRIIFKYEFKKEISLLVIGDHNIYN